MTRSGSFVVLRISRHRVDLPLSHVDYHGRDHGLPDALVAAAMQAVRLGHDAEAKTILEGIGLQRLRLHHFSSRWSYKNDIVRLLLTAAVRAALEGREPHLMDVAPEEVHSALRPRKRPPTAREYESAVKRLLTVPQQGQQPRRKRRKPKLDDKQREETIHVLKHRIQPLLPLVSAIAQLLRTTDVAMDVASALGPSGASWCICGIISLSRRPAVHLAGRLRAYSQCGECG